jgi:hypothetical protein
LGGEGDSCAVEEPDGVKLQVIVLGGMIFLLAEYNCYGIKPPEIFGFGAIGNAPVFQKC